MPSPPKQSELDGSCIDDDNMLVQIVNKVLNSISSNRTISKQEAVMHIARLPLVSCSESIVPVYANGYYKITKKDKNDDLISQYAHRTRSMWHLTLGEYFYQEYADKKKTTKEAIMHIAGLNSTPVYPMNYDYARSILIFHKPWRGVQRNLFSDHRAVINEAEEYVRSNNCCTAVKHAYTRAKCRHETGIDILENNKQADDSAESNVGILDEDLKILMEYSNSFQRKFKDAAAMSGYQFDVGANFNWATSFVDNGGRNWLVDKIAEHNKLSDHSSIDDGKLQESNDSCLDIPTKSDGSEYLMKQLKGNQKTVVCAVVNNLMKWIDYANDQCQTYKPLRMTVLGKAGSGKSFVIQTIVSETRKLLKRNFSVLVVAPTGSAAYNVNAQTIHRQFRVSTGLFSKNISAEASGKMKQELKHLSMIIIDERSMVDCKTLRRAERNIRQTVYQGKNESFAWGAIPVVLVLGDDYQLPPVNNGVIHGFWNLCNKGNKKIADKKTEELEGLSLFLDQTDTAIELETSFRQDSNEDEFRKTLDCVRLGKSTNMTAKQLMALHQSNYLQGAWQEISKNATYLFANKAPKDEHNMKMLSITSNAQNPVAVIRSKLESTEQSSKKPSWQHFGKDDDITKVSPICVNAKVAIRGYNFYPKWGLHNGAMGTVKEIAFSHGKNPNNGDLPEYVVVQFNDLNLPKEVQDDCKSKVMMTST